MAETAIKFTPVDLESRKKLMLHSGDTVKVWQKIQEKDKTRLQAFDGLILCVKHGTEAGATFTVRKVVDGIGVERIFPLYSPVIDRIEVLKKAKTRRAKLYHVREKAAKEIRKRMKMELNEVEAPAVKSEVQEKPEAKVEEKKEETK